VDGTVAVAGEFTEKCYDHGPERSAQRNFGAAKASGKFLLFIDSDMILTPSVAEECVNSCMEKDVAGAYIPEKIVGEGFLIKVRNFERKFYTGTVIDAVRFIRKDVFESVNGFDEMLTGPEDWDLDRRIKEKGRFVIINSPLLHNEGDFDVGNYIGKKEYYIKKGLEAYKKKWDNDKIVNMQLGAYYRLWRVFTENGKWKRLFRHPILMVGMYYLRLRVGLAYIFNKNKIHKNNGNHLPF
jgi:glycosyltransferase involved in cell wall biosynthesis